MRTADNQSWHPGPPCPLLSRSSWPACLSLQPFYRVLKSRLAQENIQQGTLSPYSSVQHTLNFLSR
jgi:hypothetical protein